MWGVCVEGNSEIQNPDYYDQHYGVSQADVPRPGSRRARAAPPFTSSTITTRAALLAELEQVRLDGFAANHEERYEGVCGVAAPVLDTIGVARFAIGIQGPSVRLTDERLLELGPVLVRTAREVAALVLAAN